MSPLNASLIAHESLELLRSSKEQIGYMTAIFMSIRSDFQHGKSLNVKAPSELGGYLGDDWTNHVDCQVAELQKSLDLLGVGQ